MLIDQKMDLKDAQLYFRKFIGICGMNVWKKRFEWLDEQKKRNPFVDALLKERYPIEIKVREVLDYEKNTGRFLLDGNDPVGYRLATLFMIGWEIFDRLSVKGKRRFEGMLRDSLMNNEYGISSLEFEIVIAIHLMRHGFDVEFCDIEASEAEGGPIYDLLAKNRDIEVEIDCAIVTADIGRKIHRQKFYATCGVIGPVIQNFIDKRDNNYAISIIMEDRLSGSSAQNQDIRDELSKALRQANFPCTCRRKDFTISIDTIDNRLHDYLYNRPDLSNEHIMILGSSRGGKAFLSFRSQKPDMVLKGIYRAMKSKAERQFSKDRPAIICMRLMDLSNQEIEELASLENTDPNKATGLQIMCNYFLSSVTRQHILSVCFMSIGDLTTTSQLRKFLTHDIETRKIASAGHVYYFSNRQHSKHSDPRFKIFGNS